MLKVKRLLAIGPQPQDDKMHAEATSIMITSHIGEPGEALDLPA
jgi:hypothetical protein